MLQSLAKAGRSVERAKGEQQKPVACSGPRKRSRKFTPVLHPLQPTGFFASVMHSYQFHIGDYRSGVINMTRLERWIYRDLLDICYDTEAPLPADIDKVCVRVGARDQEERDAVASVLDQKFTLAENGYVNDRVAAEIDRFRARGDAAKQSAGRRWQNAKGRSTSEDDANAMQAQCERNANASTPDANAMPIDANREPITDNRKPLTEVEAPVAAEKPLRSRGSRLPAGCPTDEEIEWCRQQRPDLDPMMTRDRFRDHWTAAAGSKGVKADWPATWRNWVRNERGTHGNHQQQKFNHNASIRRAEQAAIAREMDGAVAAAHDGHLRAQVQVAFPGRGIDD